MSRGVVSAGALSILNETHHPPLYLAVRCPSGELVYAKPLVPPHKREVFTITAGRTDKEGFGEDIKLDASDPLGRDRVKNHL